MSIKNLCMWALLLTSGVIVGLTMIVPEILIMLFAWMLGARDVSWRDLGFVLRQFTDLRFLRNQYPLRPSAEKKR